MIRFHCILQFVLQVLEEEHGLSKDDFTKLKAEHEYVFIKYIVFLIHNDILINSLINHAKVLINVFSLVKL